MKRIKNIAVINDISGVGRCSLTAAIPIISALGSQCLPVPTAILSNQTGFNKFTFFDFTNYLDDYLDVWVGESRKLDVIYTGFLGSKDQISIITKFIEKNPKSLIVTDPIMGDHGVVYKTYTKDMCNELKKLVSISDIITPNLTEACILLDYDLDINKYSLDDIKNIAKDLSKLGPSKVIITGIQKFDEIINVFFSKAENESYVCKSKKIGGSFSGTGDIFVSIYTSLILKGIDDTKAIEIATNFIEKTIEYTIEVCNDSREGICFEKYLPDLILSLKE